MIRIDALRGRFGQFELDVSLRVERGEYMVVLGPSGSGKSLLLGLVAGLYEAQSGVVWFGATDVTKLPPEQRGLGFVFQKASLFPHLSVTENIAFGLRERHLSRAVRLERLEALVRELAIADLLERPVDGLSGGEAQKVAIARALAPRPDILLLDEPLSLVDHNARLELQEVLRRLHRSLGFTALHITHNRDEARALGSRCTVMLGGRVVQDGSTAEVFDQPRCTFVAHFLGVPERAPAKQTDAPVCGRSCLGGTGVCDAAHSGDAVMVQARSDGHAPA